MENLFQKYRDFIAYAFFGICTTLVNVAAYYFCVHIIRLPTVPGTVIAWFLAVLFAYMTNRKWVFKSTAVGPRQIIRECLAFLICRMITGIFDITVMYVTVDLLLLNDLLMKAISNVVVILINYVASKWIIFEKT